MPKIEADRLRTVFAGLRDAPKDLLADVSAAGDLLTVPPGTKLYAPGDECTGIGLLIAGEIRVYTIGESGREITLYEILPGETCILNVSCLLSATPYPAYAEAVEPLEVLSLPSREFRRLIDAHPAMREYMFALLGRRLAMVMELVEEVAFGRMDLRLADYLLAKSENDVVDRTHQQIANDLGTSREVVSRLLKQMERSGKVRALRGRIELTDAFHDSVT
jgi:CRP/FNR family transcriptional regulator